MLTTPKIEAARRLSLKVHTEIDRDGHPHHVHVQRVAELAAELSNNDEDVIIGAYTHDMIEDTEITYTNIVAKFGEKIGDATVSVTRFDGESFEDFTFRCDANPTGRIVRLADMLANMERIDDQMRKQEHLYIWAIAFIKRRPLIAV